MNKRWTPVHASILEAIFRALDVQGIDWVVIRNFEGLPVENKSNDVDVAVAKSNWARVDTLLKEILVEYGYTRFVCERYHAICCYTFFGCVEGSFKFDLFDSNEYRGLFTHSFNDLYASRVENTMGCKVTSELLNNIIIFLRPVLGGGGGKVRYINDIMSYYDAFPEEFVGELCRIFGSSTAKRIKLYMGARIQSVVVLRKLMILSLFYKNFIKSPLRTLFHIANHYVVTVRTIYLRLKRRYFIAIIGPDGVGKSTFLEGFEAALGRMYCTDKKSHIYHHRPTILPNLGAVGEKAKVMTQDKDFTNPHRAKPAGRLNSLFRMSYYWLDYFIGVPIQIRKDARFDKFTIYDRYIYDFLIDPHRSRINLPYWVRRLFTKMVKQPRLVFVLLTDAETIYGRKQELTKPEIERQLGEFKRLAKTHDRFVVLDASKTPEELVEDALGVIVEHFMEVL